MIWVNAVVQGILLGGLYALLACGLSLLFGVMRVINLAHGDLALLGTFMVVLVTEHLGLSPYAALAIATAALGGTFLGMRSSFDPTLGPAQLIFAFEAVVIGGLGSVWGTLVGGIVLGLAQTVGAQAINPDWSILCGHFVFLLVLAFRSGGIFVAREVQA